MNDETENIPGETGQPAPQETEAETVPVDDWTVTEGTESTEETEAITIQMIQDIGSDIVHVNLFGSFLICGTLIGLALLRKVYGTYS